MKKETIEIIIAFALFVLFYGSGVFVYYSGYPQIGERIALISCVIMTMWGFGFAAVHTQPQETQ